MPDSELLNRMREDVGAATSSGDECAESKKTGCSAVSWTRGTDRVRSGTALPATARSAPQLRHASHSAVLLVSQQSHDQAARLIRPPRIA